MNVGLCCEPAARGNDLAAHSLANTSRHTAGTAAHAV
jgi:hypothetical protein